MRGCWEVSLPVTDAVTVEIQGQGKQVPSWRSSLGLKDFENEYQFETLKVSMQSSPSSELKNTIEGCYTLLPKCGGACGSLRRRDSTDSAPQMYFFLDSGRRSIPKNDNYMFSQSCHRTSHGEYRETPLRIDPSQEYRPMCLTSKCASV